MTADFEWWMCHKGQRLTSLQVEWSSCTFDVLPCGTNLRQLDLDGRLRQPLIVSYAALLHLAAATALTCVSFSNVTLCVLRQHDPFDVLARLPSLKCLTWTNVTVRYRQAEGDHQDPLPHPDPPASFLQRATTLTYLQADWHLTDETLQQLSGLQRLEELHLQRPPSGSAAGLAAL